MSKFKCGGSPSKNIRKEEHNTSFKVELADREGNKWISSNRSPHDSIPVKLNPETAEEWGIERSTSNALWSFYILSDHRKKMYVTYNDSKNDVTLEYEDDIKNNKEMRRYFTMLLQPELGLLLRAENAYDRYLGKNNEVLEMVKTDTPTYDMHWLIASSFEMINASFLIGKSVGGVTLQCTSNSQYVSAPSDNGDLIFVPREEMATSWDIEIMSVVLKKDDDSFIFPALSSRKKRA
ncbi:uncharacterized protein LOC144424560 isoform X2 [Styela clava]